MGNFSINLNTLFAATATLIAVGGWIALWRKTTITEGRHLEEVKNMKDRLTEVEKRSEFLRGCTEEANAELKSLRTDMGWVKTTLSEIKELLRKP